MVKKGARGGLSRITLVDPHRNRGKTLGFRFHTTGGHSCLMMTPVASTLSLYGYNMCLRGGRRSSIALNTGEVPQLLLLFYH